MKEPELQALRQGDADAWDAAFDWLWPTALEVVRLKLQPFLPGEVEDVSIEALEQLVEHVPKLKRTDELKPLLASIAHNRAVSRLREHFAAKRGAGQTQSLEEIQTEQPVDCRDSNGPSPVMNLEQAELQGLLSELLSQLKPEQRAIMMDFYLHGLSYEQISQGRGVPQGTIGVYLRRGLELIRRATERHPRLLKELTAFLRCMV